MYNEYIARAKRRERLNRAAPHIQKIVRGFLGTLIIQYNAIIFILLLLLLARRGSIRLYFLRNAMRSWMQGNVEYAQHYMERFYEKKDFRTRNKPVVDEMQEEVNRKRKERGMNQYHH